jgi:hypothetical protein
MYTAGKWQRTDENTVVASSVPHSFGLNPHQGSLIILCGKNISCEKNIVTSDQVPLVTEIISYTLISESSDMSARLKRFPMTMSVLS